MNHILVKQLRMALRNPKAVDELLLHLETRRVPTNCHVTWGERHVPLSRGRHHGGYASLFPRQPVLRFESDLERRVLKQLAAVPTCIALATQPVTVRFRFNSRPRRYTPDVLVIFESVPTALAATGCRRFTFVEVKPPNFADNAPGLWSARCDALEETLGIPLVRLPQRGGK